MADEHIRAPDDKLRPDVPPAGGRAGARGSLDNHRATADRAETESAAEPTHGLLYEAQMLVRWLIGLVIVLVCGWGFIVVIALLDRKWHVGIPLEVAGSLAALLSLGMFILLERNFWLSHFMGLRIGLHASPLAEAALLWFLGVPGLLFRSTATPSPEVTTAKTRAPADADSLREVVETVVFVIVLVLMLKTFVAEAFVIPTGSMATTLLGYHRDVTCPACGYEFPVNISAEVDPQNNRPEQITGCTCPNCRLHISFDLQNHEAGFIP